MSVTQSFREGLKASGKFSTDDIDYIVSVFERNSNLLETEITPEEKKKAVKAMMDDYPEAGSGNSLKCLSHPPISIEKSPHYLDGVFIFIDEETGKEHKVGMNMLLKGFDKLMELCLRGEYHNGAFPIGIFGKNPDCDATDCDALVQCAIFSKIIYG